MYDDLVKKLRFCVGAITCNRCEWRENCYPGLPEKQAADAIEQLSNAGSAYGRGWTLWYDAGREESKPRWIPVTERLPEEYSIVLLYSYGDVIVGSYDSEYKEFRELNGFHRLCTHWMPRPVPPKEET